jgi:hypothetical protein
MFRNNCTQRSKLARLCQLHTKKSMEDTSFLNAYTQKGNNNTKLVRPTLEYGAVCWDPYRGQVSVLNWAQKRAAKFANNINGSGSSSSSSSIGGAGGNPAYRT